MRTVKTSEQPYIVLTGGYVFTCFWYILEYWQEKEKRPVIDWRIWHSYVKWWVECTQKNKKMKNVKTLVFGGCVWTSYALTLAHSVAKKSSWMKEVQGRYLPFFTLKSETDIYLFT